MSASARVARRRSLVRTTDSPERLLVEVVDRRRPAGELALGESGKAGDGQHDVVDDDRRAAERQQVAHADHRVAGVTSEVLGLALRRRSPRANESSLTSG